MVTVLKIIKGRCLAGGGGCDKGVLAGCYDFIVDNLHLVNLQQGVLFDRVDDYDYLTIRNSSVTGTATPAAFVGLVDNGFVSILNSYAHASVTGCGGFISETLQGAHVKIEGSHFKGNVRSEDCEAVGGLIGYAYYFGGLDTTNWGFIRNSYVEGYLESARPTGSLGGRTGSVGGLIGYQGEFSTALISQIADSYFRGILVLPNQAYTSNFSPTHCQRDDYPGSAVGIGGLVGADDSANGQTVTITGSYANASIYAFDCMGGLIGTAASAASYDNYAVSRYLNEYTEQNFVQAQGGLIGLPLNSLRIGRSYGSVVIDKLPYEDGSLPTSWGDTAGGIFGYLPWYNGELETDSVYYVDNYFPSHYEFLADPDYCDLNLSIFCDPNDDSARRTSTTLAIAPSIRHKANVAGFNFTGENPTWTNVEGKTGAYFVVAG
jgi:hypothetical protein